MKIRIIALGHKMPRWVSDVQDEYLNRLPKEFMVEIVEIKPETRTSGRSVEQILDYEAKKIQHYLKKDNTVVALDEKGKSISTLDLAKFIQQEESKGNHIDFIIGSADGLSTQIKQEAQLQLSISPFTLPHGMVRALLCEQLYRSYTVLQGHPYHRE